MIARCPRCRREFPAKIAGFDCGHCLVTDNQVVRIILAPPPVILKLPVPQPEPAAKKGA